MKDDKIELIRANDHLTHNMTNLLQDTVFIAMEELKKIVEQLEEVKRATENSMDKTN
jgi:tetrahydromethanopterin S-methyltransferase subunit B